VLFIIIFSTLSFLIGFVYFISRVLIVQPAYVSAALSLSLLVCRFRESLIARASRVCTIGLDSDLFQNSVTGISIQSNRAFIIPIYAARYRYGMCTLEYQASNVTAVFKVTTFCMDSSLSSLINRIASYTTLCWNSAHVATSRCRNSSPPPKWPILCRVGR